MTPAISIDYYTDILCVWAWIAQRRVEELESEWGEQIHFRSVCVDVFGDTAAKMATQWRDRGGYAGFGQHVRESAAAYEDAPVHRDIWEKVRPLTSANAHLVLKATALVASEVANSKIANEMRKAFFIDARDIGRIEVALEVAEAAGVDREGLRDVLDSGQAMAALVSDYKKAEENRIKGSPSWVMNEGRQILYGNVSYRVLQANVEELLHQPEQEASWCS